MFDPERFQLYDAERRLMLAVMPLTREEALAQIPGEFVVGDRLLAKRLGVEAVPEDVMNARFSEFAAEPEEKILRLWMNASENADSCDIFVSPLTRSQMRAVHPTGASKAAVFSWATSPCSQNGSPRFTA